MTDLGFIVKMVIYKCRELGNPVTETLAAYVAQTTLNKRKQEILCWGVILNSDCYRYWQVLLGGTGNGRRGEKTCEENHKAPVADRVSVSEHD